MMVHVIDGHIQYTFVLWKKYTKPEGVNKNL